MMMGIDSVTLKVTPEVLLNKSVSVGKNVSGMKKRFEEIKKYVNLTSGYWMGEAADVHRKAYKSKETDVETIFKRLEEHVRELGEMARVYSDTEASVEGLVRENLPIDVIT